MKATLEFKLPDEAAELEYAQRGTDFFCALHAFYEWLFNEVDENGREELRPVLEKLQSEMVDHDVEKFFN